MKTLQDYLLTEKHNFLVKRKLTNRQKAYKYAPQNLIELVNIIAELLNDGETNLNCIDVSAITDMNYLFYELTSKVPQNILLQLTYLDISDWDVSNVTNMAGMFWGCNNLNIDVSKWNVSKVTKMDHMFWNCHKFNCDLSDWDVSNVKNMKEMFTGCNNFNSDISNWDVSNVTDMRLMFYNCFAFDQDLDEWDVNSQIVKIGRMFEGCKTLEKNNKIPYWTSLPEF